MAKATRALQVPDPTPSLAERIKAARAEAEAFIESKVRELKASPDACQLPIDWIRLNLRATTRGGGCHCRVALALLEENKKQ